jgi:hypothetical protein
LKIYSVLMFVASGAALSCIPTPRPEDAPAPRDYFRQATAPKRRCEPAVEVLRSPAEARGNYKELASLSASCYPGTPRLCEDRLAERACELKADAIILMAPTAGGTPPNTSGQSEISMSARAVRWSTE